MAETGTVGEKHELTAADKALLEQGGNLHKVTVQTPYFEYPRHLHKLGKEKGQPAQIILVVTSDEEKAAGLADGWSLTPIPLPAEGDEPEVQQAPKGKKK